MDHRPDASIEIPSTFARRLSDSLGDEGRRWLGALPAVVADFSREWGMTIGPPFGLSFNYVARARLADGTDAVFKICPWEDGEIEREIDALRQYDGRGACRLLAADPARRAMLLERLRPGTMLLETAAHDDDAATRIGAALMQRLWQPAETLPDPRRFKPLAEWFTRAFALHRSAYGGPGPFPAAVLDRAEAVTRDLLASAPREVLLHGDFHHYNVLTSDRDAGGGQWLAIDPKGMLGDPGYEVGPFLLNPHGPPKSAARLGRRLDIFAETLDYDRARLQAWGIAHAVLSACWSAEDFGDGWQDAMAMAQTLIDL
jgi:streptomycin 6-kinase